MTEILGIVLVSTTAVAVPLTGWISQRFTREARLIRRLGVLGDLRDKLPESPEKTTFELHLLTLAREANEWLDPAVRNVRRVRSVATWVRAVLGAIAVLVLVPTIGQSDWVRSIFLGLAVGAAGGVVVFPVEEITVRCVKRHVSRVTARARAAEDAARLEGLGATLMAPDKRTAHT